MKLFGARTAFRSYLVPALISLLLSTIAAFSAYIAVNAAVSATNPAAKQPQSVSCAETIVLGRGQSLASIAARAFGTQDGVTDIMAATNAMAALDASFTQILDPNAVEAGWKICVPATRASDSADEASGITGADSITNTDSVTGTGNVTGTGSVVTRYQSANAALATNARRSKGRLDTERRKIASIPRGNLPLEQDGQLLQSLLAARSTPEGIHPLSIDYLRQQTYPASTLTVEGTLPGGDNYSQFLVSYPSEELKLYAAMTVPTGERPATGWPAIIFIHGYIEPSIYSPTERYVEYVDALAINGYIVLRPDLRGHGNSEGDAYGAYGDPSYSIDVLNALAALQHHADTDPDRIGLWGHSMGGFITARAMVVSDDIQAGVIWAGVVAPYEDFAAHWGSPGKPSPLAIGELPVPSVLAAVHGSPEENPDFWRTLSANNYLDSLSGPVQLHHGTADMEVPVAFSNSLYEELLAAGQMAEYYIYEGDDHNIAAGFADAMRRSLEFLDTHVKMASPAQAAPQSIP